MKFISSVKLLLSNKSKAVNTLVLHHKEKIKHYKKVSGVLNQPTVRKTKYFLFLFKLCQKVT